MRDEAIKKEKCSEKLSVDDMIKKYEDSTGFKFGKESEQYNERIKLCRRILDEQGVITTKVRIKHLLNHLPYFLKSSYIDCTFIIKFVR